MLPLFLYKPCKMDQPTIHNRLHLSIHLCEFEKPLCAAKIHHVNTCIYLESKCYFYCSLIRGHETL